MVAYVVLAINFKFEVRSDLRDCLEASHAKLVMFCISVICIFRKLRGCNTEEATLAVYFCLLVPAWAGQSAQQLLIQWVFRLYSTLFCN